MRLAEEFCSNTLHETERTKSVVLALRFCKGDKFRPLTFNFPKPSKD